MRNWEIWDVLAATSLAIIMFFALLGVFVLLAVLVETFGEPKEIVPVFCKSEEGLICFGETKEEVK